MHLPWYQMDNDAFLKAELLARHLRIPASHGVGIAMCVWRWAFMLAAPEDFSGKVTDTESLAAAADWPIDDAQRLIREMQRVGFVATAPDLRVRGLDRYAPTWRKNNRTPHKQPDSHTVRSATGENPRETVRPDGQNERQTQTQTQTQSKEKHAGKKRPPAALPEGPGYRETVAMLCDTFKQEVGAEYPFSSPADPHLATRNGKAVKALMGLATGPTLQAAWVAALREPRFPRVRSLEEFASKFPHFIGGAPSAPGRPASKFLSKAEQESLYPDPVAP